MRSIRRLVLALFLGGVAALVPAAADARLFFDPADPALAGGSSVRLDASIGLTPALRALDLTPAGSGTTLRIATASPRGLCADASCALFASYFPQGATIRFTPPAAAVAVVYDSAECRGSVLFTGSAGTETFTASFGDRGRLFGAAQIGDIESVTLNDGCFAAWWREVRFVPGTGGPPPAEHADLAIVKTAPSAQVVSGGVIEYTIAVSNQGPDTARSVTVVDLLPPLATFVSSQPVANVLPPLVPDPSSGPVAVLPWSDFAASDSAAARLSIRLPDFGPDLSCESIVTNVALATSSSLEDASADNVSVRHLAFAKSSRTGVPEICGNGQDDDCNGLPDCSDPDCRELVGVCVPPPRFFDLGNTPWGVPLLPDGTPDPNFVPGPAFDPTQPLSPDNLPEPPPCRATNIHGSSRSVPQYCCDGQGGHGNAGACAPPADPNFKTSVPAVNALGHALVPAGQRIEYTIHYENVGAGPAHDVRVLDVLDEDLDAATLSIGDGGVYDAATRTLWWTDALLPAATARTVHFAVNLRSDAPGNTRARNVATVIFPDAVPPSRIDTNPTEHVVVDPRAPLQPDLVVSACTPAGPGAWSVTLANRGFGYAYDVGAEIVDPPAAISVAGPGARFAPPGELPGTLATVVPLTRTESDTTVAFTSVAVGDPCPALAWRIQWREQGGSGPLRTREVRLAADADRDAVPDARDVCPQVYDPAQADEDGDGTGDACEPLVAISDLIARAKCEKVDLRWTPPPGAVSWQILRRRGAEAFAEIARGAVSGGNVYVDRGLAEGRYDYLVRSVEAAGRTSPDSNLATVTVGPRATPACGLLGIEMLPPIACATFVRRRRHRA